MDENKKNDGQMPKQMTEKEHTEQNTKKALQAAEKGAATYFAGPEGAAAVNALHNAPVVGGALNKVEDKAVEKLGKNKNVANLANKLGDSGITDAANKGLDAVGAAGGGGAGAASGAAKGASAAGSAASGASSSATNAAKGINNGLGKLPGGGNNSSSGSNNSNNSDNSDNYDDNNGGGDSSLDDEKSPAEKIEASVAKAGKVLKIIGPALPYIGGLIVTILVVIMVMAEIMVIRDKVMGAIQTVIKTEQKLQNFVTGNGWYTEDESFFKRLTLAYSDYKKASSDELDIPLIAATVHYSKVTDMNVWDGDAKSADNSDVNTEIGKGENNYTDAQDSGIGSSLIETFQTWSFYQVANAKLGTWNTLIPGGRGLLGHLVTTTFTVEPVCITDAYAGWSSFVSDLFNLPDFSVYQDAYGVSGETVSNFISALIFGQEGSLTKMLNPYNLVDTMNNIIAFNDQGQSYPEWWQENVVYEIKELGQYLSGKVDDQQLKDTPSSYYNNLPDSPAPQNFVEELSNFWTQFLNVFNSVHYDSENNCITVPVPVLKRTMDYKSYYRYLVNIYIPITYYRGETLGKDYSFLEVVETANAMFDQKYLYEYLVGKESDNVSSGCSYTFSGGSSATVSVDKNMIDNLYVHVLSPSCGTNSSSCTDVEETVSLKDYVMGVVYREIGASLTDNAEYLKANMIAAKSYTVGRRTAVQDGDKYYIKMLNSTNDQVYCSVTKGCMDASSNRKQAPSADLLAYLGKLYDEVSNQFLYNSSNKNFTGSYRAKASQCVGAGITGACLGQVESKEMGDAGQSYQGILGHFYTDPIGLVDISTGKFSIGVQQCISTGLQLGTDGYYVRTTKPESTNIYFNSPYVSDSNRGQCVWYVKGRAQEIIANSTADAEKKQKAKDAITAATGNGNQWYNKGLQSVFGSSQDYTKPKAGAIAVYTWTDAHCASYWGGTCKENYGHSLIVESVSGDTVTISQGWTKCSTGSPSWSCVEFDYSSHPISYMKNLGGNYEFIGYIYLLD